jgi:hypothetical protein
VTIRTRKLIGTVALIALLVVWLFLGLALAPVALGSAGVLRMIAFYGVAGLGWLVVAMPLVKWMGRPDRTQ